VNPPSRSSTLPTGPEPSGEPVFVGRSVERTAIEEAWLQARAGRRQALFLGGEPGAGKSRILREVAREVRRLGGVTLSGQCVMDLGLPYQPFDDPAVQLRSCLANRAGMETGEDLDGRIEDVTTRLGVLAGDERALVSTGPDVDERRALYGAFVTAIQSAAADAPVLLVLDDLHWAGTTALQLLTFLVERSTDLPLLILGAHRTTLPDRSAELVEQVARLYRLEGVRRLDLAPLDTEQIVEYLVRQGSVPRPRAGRAAVLLRDRTGGNPFYLRELWGHLARAGGVAALTGEQLTTPHAIADALAVRILGLGERQRSLLSLTAVLGERVSERELGSLVDDVDDLAAIDDLVGAGLLEGEPGRRGDYRFVHALVRQAVLDSLPVGERARSHERIALMLERRGEPVHRLAHHFAGAALLGHAPQAVDYLIKAAEQADRSLAHAEAAVLFEQAALLCDASADRDACWLRAARSHHLACDFERAAGLCDQVVRHGDPSVQPEAAIALEEYSWHTAGPGRGPANVQILGEVLTRADLEADSPLRTRLLAGMARAMALSGEQDEAEQLVSGSIAAARASGDEALLGSALAASMQVGLRPRFNDGKLERAGELTRLALRIGQWPYLGPASYHRSVICYQNGDSRGMSDARRDLERTAAAAGQRYWSYMAGCAAYAEAFVRGDFELADQLCDSAAELGGSFSGGASEGLYGVQSFMVRRETGQVQRVRSLITGTEDYAGHWLPALLALYTELELWDPARRLLGHLLTTDLQVDEQSALWPAAVGFVAEAALALKDQEAARAVLPMMEEYAGLNLVMGPFAAVFGAADRYLGSLHSLLGDSTAAGDRFAGAAALDDSTGATLHRGYTLAAWARHADVTRDPATAIRLRDEARCLADPHRTPRLWACLQDEAGRKSRPASVAGLSERELEVLRLVGSARSNREIAQALTISEHTAANHVRNIMVKIGCTNRTQAAMYASTHGLLD
jgi:DNA-binding CsgD family transcriptional regulator